MNKYLMILALAAGVAGATPAYANDFVGFRVGVTAGADDVTGVQDTTDIVYGAEAGIDFPVGDTVTIGVEAFSTNPFEGERTIGAAARIGYVVADNALVFARAGYSNYKNVFNQKLDGLTVGAGLEVAVSDNTYIKTEYRYSDFEQNVGNHSALIGVGLRF